MIQELFGIGIFFPNGSGDLMGDSLDRKGFQWVFGGGNMMILGSFHL